ncbi:MAG: hypothetical protein Q9N02_03130 [Ghiorsea sp.]|nr:hypothetical protein [Ghiorsea sp.]
MRVTQNQMYDSLTVGINKQLKIKNDANAAISSGKRFQRPSQAGLDYKISLDLRHTQSQIKGSVGALSTANSRLSASQTMLKDISNVLTRAQTLAVQQSSAQTGTGEQLTAAVEVRHLLDQVANSTNQTWMGESLFAGTNTDATAFVQDATGAYQYQGTNQDRTVAINTNQNMTTNVRGDEAAFTNTFTALQSFITALESGDRQGISNAIGNLTKATNDMIDLTSRVGGQISAIQSYKASYDDMSFAIDKRLSEHESADVAKLVVDMQTADIALKSAYTQIANLKSMSLINYLR